MIAVVPFKKEHFRDEAMQQVMEYVNFHPDEAYLNNIEKFQMSFCGLDDQGKVVGIAGILPLWNGVGEAWSFLTPEVQKHPFTLHRAVKRGLEKIMNERCFHRVQTNVLLGNKVGEYWAERLGFHFESFLPMYGPNKESYSRYVILNS